MSVVEMQIPQVLSDLYAPEQDRLLRGALRQYTRLRLHGLLAEMQEAQKHIQQFEAQYGMSLSELERQGLPENASVEAHEDYNRWFFWQSVLDRQQEIVKRLRDVALLSHETAT